jgi:hypothetical protein
LPPRRPECRLPLRTRPGGTMKIVKALLVLVLVLAAVLVLGGYLISP